MSKLQVPQFRTYGEGAAFWDNVDTAPFIEDDGERFRFETPSKRAIRVAILPDVAAELIQRHTNKRRATDVRFQFLLYPKVGFFLGAFLAVGGFCTEPLQIDEAIVGEIGYCGCTS